MTKKVCLVITCILLPFLLIAPVMAQPPIDVPNDHTQRNIQKNVVQQFKFGNGFNLSYQGNVTTDIDIDCDNQTTMNKQFNMSYQSQNSVKINVSINASNSVLIDQSRIRVQNGSLYQFRHRIVVNISRNTTEVMRTTLRVNVTESNCTWVYYNETSETFEIMDSWYEDGYLTTNVTHFSTYAVLGGIEESTEDGTDWKIYAIIGGIVGGIILGYVAYKYMKKKKKKDEDEYYVPDDCEPEDRLPDGTCKPIEKEE